MTAISRSRVNIYIANADTAISSLTPTDIYAGDIKSYSKSGGETDVESDPVFGGFVDKEKPTTQYELGFEVIPRIDTISIADRWDKLAYAYEASPGVYTAATSGTGVTLPGEKMIVLEALTGTSTPKIIAFNNCIVTVLDFEHNADDNRTYNITFKFSPTTPNGVSNFMTAFKTRATMPAWTALANNS